MKGQTMSNSVLLITDDFPEPFGPTMAYSLLVIEIDLRLVLDDHPVLVDRQRIEPAPVPELGSRADSSESLHELLREDVRILHDFCNRVRRE